MIHLQQPKPASPALKIGALACLPVLATLVVFWQGSLAGGPKTPGIHDKLAHFVVFGGLAVLCVPVLRAIASTTGLPRFAQMVWCVAYATLMGGLLEIWQATLPHRSAEWLDFLADFGGAAVASVVVWLFTASRKQ